MARYTGKDLAVQWIWSGGTAWLEPDFRGFNTTEELSEADSTAGDDTYEASIPTVISGGAEMSILDTTGATGTANWAAIAPGNVGTVTWYPEGTASTKPTHTAAAHITKRDRDFPYDDMVSIDTGWKFTGAPTAGTVS